MVKYPPMDQYNDAVQHPHTAFSDPVLQSGAVATTGLGVPLALGGGFAITYPTTAQGRKYAVRCFHKASPDLEQRYEKISQFVRTTGGNYFVGFEYQPNGILVNGSRYPIVKMEWAAGDTLGSFLENNYANKSALTKLRTDFLNLEKFLTSKTLAHGDLQNGNVLVSGGLRLIDYDGMYVPGLAIGRGTETGHKHFQHPKRSAADFGPKMDRFSLIAIDLGLRALIEKPDLFNKYSNGDNILFTANDFGDPGRSTIFGELRSVKTIAKEVSNFAQICSAPVGAVPALSDFMAGRNIPTQAIILKPHTRTSKQKLAAYIGAYDVLDATDFDAVEKHIGDRIELIGKITEVKVATTKYGRPYTFLNFGPWRGRVTKINIWSDGLAKLTKSPDETWVGKWISVVGLVDPPFTSRRYRYTHLSITLTEANQLRVIDNNEAQRRLGSKAGVSDPIGVQGNQTVLDSLAGKSSTKRRHRPSGTPTATKRSNRPSGTPAAAVSAQERNKAILKTLGQPQHTTSAVGKKRSSGQRAPTPAAGNPNWSILWVWCLIIFVAFMIFSALARGH